MKFHLEKLAVLDVDVPTPGRGEVLVQVRASNINPVDHKVVEMAGMLWSYPHKMGFDVAGVAVAVGPDCQRIKVGDEVWGEATTYLEAVSTAGTYAQYAAVSESVLGLKPKALTWPEAGAMPMVALTGYDALLWAAGGDKFTKDDVTVLVLGGSGGTGHLGIQLAKAMGAKHVVTTCSSSNADFVKGLGADQVIDYHMQNYWEVLTAKSVDFVYDCVGQSGTGEKSYPLLKEGGHFASLLTTGMPSIATKLSRYDVSAKAPLCIGDCSQHGRMDSIATFVEQGLLKVHIDVTYPLENITQAFNHSVSGHTIGKVVVAMTGASTRHIVV